MLVSILHRATGDGMATVGTILFVWWLAALAGGAESYSVFLDTFTSRDGALNVLGWIVAVGLTLALFQHMMTGIRHFFLDVGAGYELKTMKTWSAVTIVGALVLTALYWAYIMGVK